MPGPPHPVAGRARACEGTVQGVGFRPYVYRLARASSARRLGGQRRARRVLEAEGDAAAVERFLAPLPREAPPLAVVERVRAGASRRRARATSRSWRARPAAQPTRGRARLRDVRGLPARARDPADRRFRYPFVNCTNCGPRFTIVRGVPYDRPRTTMAGFAMCPACRAEYEDPADRRFHAQPNACPDCGPRAWLVDARRSAPRRRGARRGRGRRRGAARRRDRGRQGDRRLPPRLPRRRRARRRRAAGAQAARGPAVRADGGRRRRGPRARRARRRRRRRC